MIEYSIYVGLSDPVTHKQMFSTEEYTSVLKQICINHRAPFSFNVIQGGYIHIDGMFVEETSLQISMFDQTEEKVNEIAEDLCTFFNQESVLVAQSEAKMYYVKGDSEVYKIVNSLHEDEKKPTND